MLSRAPPQWPADFPQLLVEHLRAVDLLVVVGEATAQCSDRAFEASSSPSGARDRPGPSSWKWQQVHLAGELAMIAALGLLDLLPRTPLQLLLPGVGGGVDARQQGLFESPRRSRRRPTFIELEGVAALAGRGSCAARRTGRSEPALGDRVSALRSPEWIVHQLDLEQPRPFSKEALGFSSAAAASPASRTARRGRRSRASSSRSRGSPRG